MRAQTECGGATLLTKLKKSNKIQLKAGGQQGEGKMKAPGHPKPALSLPSCEPLAAVVRGFLEKKEQGHVPLSVAGLSSLGATAQES